MTDKPKTPEELLTELKALFGPPPVLSTESEVAYYAIMTKLLECFAPEDFMMKIFVNDLTNHTWEIRRIQRHMTLTIERRYHQHLEFQKERKQLTAERKAEVARHAEKQANPPPAFERALDAEHYLEGLVADVDEILKRGPQEHDHARGLESGIEYYERLDRTLEQAIRRRNKTLELITLYNEGLGLALRRAADQIIEGTCVEIAAEPVPLVPTEEPKP
jgi:hypothetical protein